MTKVLVYLGNENIELKFNSIINGRDTRTLYKCDNPTCKLKDENQPRGNIIPLGSNLNACKTSKECRDVVVTIWENLRKEFNKEEYINQKIDEYVKLGLIYDKAVKLAEIDLYEKLKELKIKKPKHHKKMKKKYNISQKRIEYLKQKGKLCGEYIKKGLSKSEAMTKAGWDLKENIPTQPYEEALIELLK